MTLRLENTNAGAINRAIAMERHRIGASTTGMVLTLVIVTDEEHQLEATRAASFSAGQHPCRILVLIPRPGRGKPELDAEIYIGDREGPGETIQMRLRGQLAGQQASIVLPLLLPDTPVVAWWPVNPPTFPARDGVGMLAQRRITDTATAKRPLSMLAQRVKSYRPGDTDLAWTRTTPWRSMLAASLDQPHDQVRSAVVSVEANNPSGVLLAGWLRARLGASVELEHSRGPGITGVVLSSGVGDISLTRPSGTSAMLSLPGRPERQVPLHRRELKDLVAEELRHLDSDDIYAQALANLDAGSKPREVVKAKSKTKSKTKRAPNAIKHPKAEEAGAPAKPDKSSKHRKRKKAK